MCFCNELVVYPLKLTIMFNKASKISSPSLRFLLSFHLFYSSSHNFLFFTLCSISNIQLLFTTFSLFQFNPIYLFFSFLVKFSSSVSPKNLTKRSQEVHKWSLKMLGYYSGAIDLLDTNLKPRQKEVWSLIIGVIFCNIQLERNSYIFNQWSLFFNHEYYKN